MMLEPALVVWSLVTLVIATFVALVIGAIRSVPPSNVGEAAWTPEQRKAAEAAQRRLIDRIDELEAKLADGSVEPPMGTTFETPPWGWEVIDAEENSRIWFWPQVSDEEAKTREVR